MGYRVEVQVSGPRWWRWRDYWVVSESGERFGSYPSEREAERCIAIKEGKHPWANTTT
jgi:hypothetical protein